MPKRLIRKLITVLDGSPADYGKPQRGQSIVEMALITPILIVLFASMVEVGWFANNYLILLDATRAGARIATGLVDNAAPREWDDNASWVPRDWLVVAPYTDLRMPDPGAAATSRQIGLRDRVSDSSTGCINVQEFLFFNEIVCRTLRSMSPLSIRDDITPVPGADLAVDDIVVSAFSFELIPANITGEAPFTTDPAVLPVGPDVSQLMVVGRYPTNANECQIRFNNTGTLVARPITPADRDPFDYNFNNVQDVTTGQAVGRTAGTFVVNNRYQELDGFDRLPTALADRERQVGFIWYGNHINELGCLGSEWTIPEIERAVNLPSYMRGANAAELETRRTFLPGQGLVLVELFWEHQMLLNLPFFEPIPRLFNRNGRAMVSVWAAFPVPSVEPFITFPTD